MRMAYNADGAIIVLQDGLKPDRKHSFAQADMLGSFYLILFIINSKLTYSIS